MGLTALKRRMQLHLNFSYCWYIAKKHEAFSSNDAHIISKVQVHSSLIGRFAFTLRLQGL